MFIDWQPISSVVRELNALNLCFISAKCSLCPSYNKTLNNLNFSFAPCLISLVRIVAGHNSTRGFVCIKLVYQDMTF